MIWLLLSVVVSTLFSLGTSELCTPGPELPDHSDEFQSSNLSGGVQLLIPTYQFGCIGGIAEWRARVSLQLNVSGSMEFQALRPLENDYDGVYEVTYHNEYRMENVNGSLLTLPILATDVDNLMIPVDCLDIVGIYLENVSQPLELLFDTAPSDEGVDVYYWEGLPQRRCMYSICDPDVKVMRGVRPLVSWTVDGDQSISTLNALLLFSRNSPDYCADSDIPPICQPASSVTTSVMPSSSFDSLSSSSFIEAASFPTYSAKATLSPLLTSSSSLFSYSTPSSTPSETPIDDTSILGFARETFVALVVTVFLFLIIVILLLAILLCFLQKKSSQWKVSSEAPAIDNPDYNGVVSLAMTSPAIANHVNGESLQGPETPHHLREKTSLSPSPPHFDDAHYFSAARVQGAVGSIHSKLDTQRVQSPNSTSTEKIFPSLERERVPPTFDAHDYDAPLDSNEGVDGVDKLPLGNHYYSCPPDEEQRRSPFFVDQLHVGGNVYDAIGGEILPLVPKMQDPEVAHGYDEIRILKKPGRSHTIATPMSSSSGMPGEMSQEVYAVVPTLEQRKFSSWRYEMAAGQGYDKLRFFVESNIFWAPAATTSDLYEQLAANKYREIPQHEIQVMTTLGQGQFGSVSKGVWHGPDGDYDVAVKMLKPEATEEDQVKLLQEAAIMGQFAHKNVVKLHGVVTVGEPLVMIVLEYMPRGDLRSYLRSIRPKQGRWKAPPAGLTKLLLKFCRDIGQGMSYLSRKSFVHRDLAARNILLSSDLTCKIGDFGMARDLMVENNYYHSKGGIIPLKWTAPEALNYKKYTWSSDIWSYGMVLYEIWSLGHKPFNDLSNPIVIALINSKHCQPPPPGCPRAIYQLMVQCWNPEYSLRPPFDRVCEYLDSQDEMLLHWVSSDSIPGKHTHLLGAPLEESTDLYFDLQRTYQQSMLDETNGKKRSQSTRT